MRLFSDLSLAATACWYKIRFFFFFWLFILMLTMEQILALIADEIEITAIRSQGPGGQNVNKVSSAVHLRFDINASRLPLWYKQCLLNLRDHRISKSGFIIIKAQDSRSRNTNQIDAYKRLESILENCNRKVKKRIPTRPGKASNKRRLDTKKKHGDKKRLRKQSFEY